MLNARYVVEENHKRLGVRQVNFPLVAAFSPPQLWLPDSSNGDAQKELGFPDVWHALYQKLFAKAIQGSTRTLASVHILWMWLPIWPLAICIFLKSCWRFFSEVYLAPFHLRVPRWWVCGQEVHPHHPIFFKPELQK